MTTSHVDHWLQMIGILKAHNNNLESDSQYKNKFSGLLGDLMRLAPDLKSFMILSFPSSKDSDRDWRVRQFWMFNVTCI